MRPGSGSVAARTRASVARPPGELASAVGMTVRIAAPVGRCDRAAHALDAGECRSDALGITRADEHLERRQGPGADPRPLELADTGGFHSISMRNVAKKLD